MVAFDESRVSPCLLVVQAIQTRLLDLDIPPARQHETREMCCDFHAIFTRAMEWMVDIQGIAARALIVDAKFGEWENEISCLGLGDFGIVGSCGDLAAPFLVSLPAKVGSCGDLAAPFFVSPPAKAVKSNKKSETEPAGNRLAVTQEAWLGYPEMGWQDMTPEELELVTGMRSSGGKSLAKMMGLARPLRVCSKREWQTMTRNEQIAVWEQSLGQSLGAIASWELDDHLACGWQIKEDVLLLLFSDSMREGRLADASEGA
jgi:hypothetical protein